jgi:hypothetical protein
MVNTVLSRFSQLTPNQFPDLTSTQALTDTLVGRFVEETGNWKSLAALSVGGLSYRFARIGTLSIAARVPQGGSLLRLASYGTGLIAEAGSFEASSRLFASTTGDRSNPSLWNWSGQGGVREGFTSSLLTFGILKPAGFLVREQNIALQHLFSDVAMVGGHQLSSALGVTPQPEGSLAEQLLHAEVTNLQLAAGMGLVYHLAPSALSLERGLDLSLRSQEVLIRGRFPSLSDWTLPTAELALAANSVSSSTPTPLRSNEDRNPLSETQMAMSSCNPDSSSSSGSGALKPPTGRGEEKMKIAYGLAGELVRDRLEQEDPDGLSRLKKMNPSDVVVVKGDYDHIEDVLGAAQIPFIPAPKFGVTDRILEAARAVFVNCVGNSFPIESAHRLARFVEAGGFLLTTDWALKHVIQVGFPGFVAHNGIKTPNDLVSIRLQQEDPLFKGYFEGPQPVWWLEPSSYPLQVLDRNRVQVPVYSEEMSAKYGNGSVVVRFPYGKGVVYHLVSHLYAQQNEARDARHRASASSYATSMGGSLKTQASFQQVEKSRPDVNLGSVQSATSTTGFVSSVILSEVRRQEGSTALAGGTGIFKMMNVPGVDPRLSQIPWKPQSANFSWDAKEGRYRYRMPQNIEQVVIGRLGDEVIAHDPRLSRRHVLIRRLGDGNEQGFALTAYNFVGIHRGDQTQNVDRGETAWVLPGDLLQLTPDVKFIFDPVSRK